MNITNIITKACNNQAGLHIAILTADVEGVFKEISQLGESVWCSKEVSICGNKIHVVKADRVHCGKLGGLQLNGAIWYRYYEAESDDKLYTLSRVLKPVGIFEKHHMMFCQTVNDEVEIQSVWSLSRSCAYIGIEPPHENW